MKSIRAPIFGLTSCSIKGRYSIVQFRWTWALPFCPEYSVIESTKLCQAHLLELYFLWNYSEWNRSSVFMLGKLFSSCGHQKGEKTIMEGSTVLRRWLPKGTFINDKEKINCYLDEPEWWKEASPEPRQVSGLRGTNGRNQSRFLLKQSTQIKEATASSFHMFAKCKPLSVTEKSSLLTLSNL